jgi:uncharacterized protein YqhQ
MSIVSKSRPNVGGQAVLAGVMMRSPKSMSVAVRRESGRISLKEGTWRSIWDRLTFLRWPFFRGTVVMIESMMNGIQALNFSAAEAMAEQSEEEKQKGGEAPGKVGIAFTMLLSLVFAVALFKFLPHMAASYSGKLLVGRLLTVDDVLYHVVDGIVKISIFIGYVAVIGLSKEIAGVFQYHGAEHMAIYTFEAGESLTVENARKKTRLHPRCGTAFLMVVIIVFMVVAAILMPFLPTWAKPSPDGPWYKHVLVVLLKLPLLIPVAGIAYEFNRFAGRHCDSPFLKPLLWPGLGMQLLTTKTPTDDQLEIALTSLRAVLWRETVGEAVPDKEEPVIYNDFQAFCDAHREDPKNNSKISGDIGYAGQACQN